MRRLGIAFVSTMMLGVSGAWAADIPMKAPMATPVMAPAYNWTGLYIGGNIGGGWSQSDYLNTANTTFFGDVAGPPGFSQNLSGFIGGGQVGYNWQAGSFVFGIEGMFDYSDIKGSVNPLRGGLPPLGQDDTFETRIRSLFLATARIGHAWDNWLLYVKGGYAGGDVRVSVADNAGVNQGNGSASRWRSGWTVGGGAEFGFATNWSAALEYNYVRLQSGNYDLAGAAAPLTYAFDVGTRDTHLITGRLNYRFNWGGPVVARY